ncbi:hypothetical protein QBC35DRAFT_395963 [Podospora australis]|uniref:Uncharacterized protein n=1 Tax=Podospora australis TaxID=1536484 RepID=A0AAN6WJK7_9PEZI|nr:hypothetical protein QBC35DRAFT_395963 [Podospora australis]
MNPSAFNAFHSETIVSSMHGNGASSSDAAPVNISHHSQGCVLTPPDAAGGFGVVTIGKVHFTLPSLRSPRPDAPGTAVISTQLEIQTSPHFDPDKAQGKRREIPLHGPSKIVGVELYAGHELVKAWKKDGDDVTQLPADRDFDLVVSSHLMEAEGCPGLKLNESCAGLGITITIEFRGDRPGLMVSSVGLVQIIRAI